MESDDKDSKKKGKVTLGPKKHKVPLICPNCGASSYYRKDICWLCSKSLTIKEDDTDEV